MRDTEKFGNFGCPNPDCCYVGISEGECPECGRELVKPKGDDYMYNNQDDESSEPAISDFDDDPEAVSWYNDGELETM